MDIDYNQHSAKAIADYGRLLEEELQNDHYNEDIEGGGKYHLHKFSKAKALFQVSRLILEPKPLQGLPMKK